MIELAKQGGRDMLYVESIKEFAGNSLTDLLEELMPEYQKHRQQMMAV